MLTQKTQRFLFRKHLLSVLLGFILFPGYLMAQDAGSSERTSYRFKLDATVGNVKFYHAIANCNGSKVVLLKFENQNRFPVTVTWNENFGTQLEAKTRGAKGLKKIVLPAGVTMPSGCTDNSNREIVVTPYDVQPHYVAEISSFEFTDITVKKAKQ